jgi:hypothetical protein
MALQSLQDVNHHYHTVAGDDNLAAIQGPRPDQSSNLGNI